MPSALVVACAVLALPLSTSGFAPHGPARLARPRATARQPRPTTRLSVFDKLSDEGVAAVVAAQTGGRKLAMAELGSELLLFGIVAKPEGAAGALQKAGVTSKTAAEAVGAYLRPRSEAGDELLSTTNQFGQLFAAIGTNADDTQLPYTGAAKGAFKRAIDVSERLNRVDVRSEHLLLGLLSSDRPNGVFVLWCGRRFLCPRRRSPPFPSPQAPGRSSRP